MVYRDLQRILEEWAPKELAWERDNVGSQIGSGRKIVKRILVALDVTDETIAEARRKRADVIVTHHPLLFRPLRSIDPDDRIGRLASALIRHDIALYAAHTNLDFASGGVSGALAKTLGLVEVSALCPATDLFRKIAVFIPDASVEQVTSAMATAGAGKLGNYDSCSFRTPGTGTFRATEGARPFIGKKGILERTPETRVEVLAPVWKVESILEAMRNAHPYEEVAYDVYPLLNTSARYGAGAIGTLPGAMSLRNFLSHVRSRLRVPALRHTGSPRARIRRVAVCGGSGSEHLREAIAAGADAFVTADVRFHTFQEADKKIVLVDAGHYETELPAIGAIVAFLRKEFRKRNLTITVDAAAASRNVVHYSNS